MGTRTRSAARTSPSWRGTGARRSRDGRRRTAHQRATSEAPLVTVLRAILTTVHAGTAAVWLGAMLYSLLIVQPRASSLLGKGYERLAAQLAAGARWKVIAMICVLAASGF